MTSVTLHAAIELQPHQRKAIHYLVANPDIHGILVYHQMGTGKTFLAIGLAERFPKQNVIVIAPRFIEGHWQGQLAQFEVQHPERFEFIPYHQAPEKLNHRDLSNTIVVLDEVHNLVRNLKSEESTRNREFTTLYQQLGTAQRVVALTGTPIYSNIYDLAYILNLVSGKSLLPFNEEAFRLKYTKIDRTRSLFRGYFSESMIVRNALPLFLALGGFAVTFNPLGALVGGVIGIAVPPLTNHFVALDEYPLRYFNARKMRPFLESYVSYYNVEEHHSEDYPTQSIHQVKVAYNASQTDFFLSFVESSLTNKQLRRIVQSHTETYTDAYLDINSTLIQHQMNEVLGSGRDIGNLDFMTANNTVIEPPKFLKVLDHMQKAHIPQTVVYSNYYKTGTLAFAAFLDRQGLKGQYAILHPELTATEQAAVIANYNAAKTPILLLHPEITEGISLRGTRQFHLLEPVLNDTLLRQVTARAVRFRSHEHLPVADRHVDIFLWESYIDTVNPETYIQLKRNWRKGYAELNDWSDWGRSVSQVDPNYNRKRISPDTQASLNLGKLNDDLRVFAENAQRFSCDRNYL